MNGTGTTKPVMQPRTMRLDALDTRLIRYAKAHMRTQGARGLSVANLHGGCWLKRYKVLAQVLESTQRDNNNAQDQSSTTDNGTSQCQTTGLQLRDTQRRQTKSQAQCAEKRA